MATKPLYILYHINPFTHSFSPTQLWLGVLLMDTLTLGQVEAEIEPPTFWFVDNLHEPLSHCRPSNWSGFEQEEVRFLFFYLFGIS